MWQNGKQMKNNCHILDMVQAFPYVENRGTNLIL